ncbi:reverse transcriptase domain-containing protein [Tanacetum coccineum]
MVGYDDLEKALLENYLQQKKYIKDPIELHNIKQRDGESTEDFVRIYKLESRDVKGAPECMRISKFMHGITNPELIKRLHDKIPKTVDEMIRNSGKEQPKMVKKGETFGKGKALAILMVQPWEKVARQKIIQSFSHNTEILFPPQDEDEGTKGPMIIKAEIGGHCIHRMENITNGEDWRRRTLRFGLDEFRGRKKRGQAADRNQAIQEKVRKLVEAGIMKEVHYHDWLSNPVMVMKHDDSWRMCVDFKNLNKACPKDGYPLPEIDWKVESLCGFPFKCFVNAYKGYHQLQMEKEDEEKIAFITSQGIFCYTKMPFGLRNAGATYQHLVDKAFHKYIGRNLEVYVDDIVIKSRTKDEIVRDIEETFKTLREINMKLNPKKCTFRVEEGMFLGYNINTKGMKVCPDKVDAVLSLLSPKCLIDVQKLNEKLASLNRFLAKSAEKSLSFFKTLKKCTKKSGFHWTAEAEKTFRQMKQLIVDLPMLTAPMEKEKLIVYLAAAKETVSAVLMMEREAKHMPIYFVSRALRGLKINYKSMEKQVLSRPEVAGRLHKWSIELGEYAIHYRPRVSVKGHVLADFIVERLEEESPDTLMEVEEELPEPWIIFMDGSSCTDADVKKARATNGLVERANRSLGEGIKARLGARNKKWMEELSHVLWAHRTMVKSSNGYTPFSLTYRTEAVIPAEIGMPTLRIEKVDLVQNNEALEINLDLLEERREQAAIREAKSKARMKKYYNSKVKNTSFKPGDLVYQNNDASHTEDTWKLGPKWEGPYEVTKALRKGAYKLRDHDGK